MCTAMPVFKTVRWTGWILWLALISPGANGKLNEAELLAELRVLMDKTKMARPEYFVKDSQTNRNIWNAYYDCLDKQLELASIARRLPAESISALEGGTARLECELCFPPNLLDRHTPRWTWAGEDLPEDDWVEVNSHFGTLKLYGVRGEQAGRYHCALGPTLVSRPVLLQVIGSEVGLKLVRGPNAPRGPWPQSDGLAVFPAANLVVFTDWSSWSECSRCGEVGKRYRFGACTVRLKEDAKLSPTETSVGGPGTRRTRVLGHGGTPEVPEEEVYGFIRRKRGVIGKRSMKNLTDKYRKKVRDFIHRLRDKVSKTTVGRLSSAPPATTYFPTSGGWSTSKRTKNIRTISSGYISSYEIFLLQVFSRGLPCASKLFSKSLRNDGNLLRKNELMEAYCMPPCEDDIFEVRDQYGKVLERVNNTAGFFSMLQGPPQLPPIPTRTTIFAPMGEPLEFGCPGHLLHDVPFSWTVNRTRRLHPMTMANQSDGRVTMDFRQRIIIKEVEPEDGQLYVCWQRDSIAGVVRLVVYDPSRLAIDHHILLVGTAIIFGTFVYIFTKIYLNRKKAAAA